MKPDQLWKLKGATLTAFAALVALFFYLGVTEQPPAHWHDGDLSKLTSANTWRIDLLDLTATGKHFSAPAPKSPLADRFVVGVCRHCGAVTDIEFETGTIAGRIAVAGRPEAEHEPAPPPAAREKEKIAL